MPRTSYFSSVRLFCPRTAVCCAAAVRAEADKGGACVSFRISCCGCVVAAVVALVVAVAVVVVFLVAAVIPHKMSGKQRKLAKRFLLFGGFVGEAEAGGVGAREL